MLIPEINNKTYTKTEMRTMKLILAVGFLLAFATGVNAQKQRTQTYLPKIAIKTNALYWATSTPNL